MYNEKKKKKRNPENLDEVDLFSVQDIILSLKT